MAIRDSQDLSLPVTSPTTAAIRDSQDLSLPITSPTTAAIRVSQDVTLVICKVVPFNAAFEAHDEMQQIPWMKQYFGLESQGPGDGDVINVSTFQYVIVFVAT